jgi:uncharacterized protein YegJ (DUF2314 family)
MDTEPPLQIGPVAPNHCRIGYHILQAVYAALDELGEGDEVPEEIDIRMEESDARVRVALPMLPGPKDWGGQDDEDEDDDPVLFLTVMPSGGTVDPVDEWIVPMAAALGLEPEPAQLEGGYDRAMQSAREQTQAALPAVRERFLARKVLALHRPSYGFKIGLATDEGGTEWVWIEPKSWSEPGKLTATLESEPVAVPEYRQGQTLDVKAIDIVDYIIYHPKTGEQEGGYTVRIAADYGLIIPS